MHFEYDLPKRFIALEPARPRDASRLLVVDRAAHSWYDSWFRALPHLLRPGDTLVLNNTKVLKARMFGTLDRTGRPVEVLFVSPIREDLWEVLLRPGRRVRMGDRVSLGSGCQIVVGDRRGDILREAVILEGPHLSVSQLLHAEGTVPLPPYIQRPVNDRDASEYQTVFACREGAIAAPTAGLHFTRPLLKTLGDRGIITAEVTLHVGIGTFLPVRTEDPAQHVLQPESYEISEETAHLLNTANAEGRRIIAVGTTSTRALEDVFERHGRFAPGSGKTNLYIRPGYQFRAIDGLITNFHLPRSTLALLVAAFASRELVLDAYRHAVQADYRFYSYGDCCLFF